MATPETNHQDIRELLPWYLNGSLDAADVERVRRHLELHPELETEAEDVDTLMRAVGEEVAVPMLTHERVERMMARIENEPQQAAGLTALFAGVRRWCHSLTSAPGYLPVAVATALALLAVLIVMPQTPSDDVEYRTFGEERPPVAIQIEVSDNVNATGALALFDEHGLSAKRQAPGMYMISLSGDTSVTELFDILQTLRADDRVATAKAMTEED